VLAEIAFTFISLINRIYFSIFMVINKKPSLVDLYTHDRELSARLQEDGFPMREDNAPGEAPEYGFFKIPVKLLPDYVEQYEYALRDSYDGEHIDPETMEYIEYEDLVKKIEQRENERQR